MDEAFGHWLAGFTDGEGCFAAYRAGEGIVVVFALHLREDDWPILAHIRTQLGFGYLTRSRGGAFFRVSNAKDLKRVVQLFEKYQLRAKKRKDFVLFRELVEERAKGVRADRNRVEALVTALSKIKGLDEELFVPQDDKDQLPLWAE